MAAANHPNAQPPAPHQANVGPVPPVALDDAPVPPAMQMPANPAQVAPAPPQNVVGHNHPVVQIAAGPAIPAGPFVPATPIPDPGASSLLRSLYGLSLGN
ncbi:unnamed protein product [Rhizoctonia solani]|uniref:Uncharacterized protein n=1 Tax=Rhizoctonia solani TaxID=456999 RepID=A0A8H3I4U2_9AGAM|nr:unnamed protein product [Rhizoctonia solani]